MQDQQEFLDSPAQSVSRHSLCKQTIGALGWKILRVQTFQESLRLVVERTEDIERLLERKGRGWGGGLVMFAYWSSIFLGGIEFQSSENRQFKWIGQVSNFKRRIQSLQLCRERVKHFHFRPIYGTLRLKFFFSACLQTATDGPSAGAVSTTSVAGGAENIQDGSFVRDLDGLVRANIILDKRQ